MSLYATVGAERLRATPDGPRRGECLDCSATMMAKTGNVVVWHWAHQMRPLDCQAAYEGEWHLQWKSLALEGTQEVPHPSGKRRADVLTPGSFAVEFQASSMTAEEVQAREVDWDNKLVWVFDAREAFAKERLRVMGSSKQRGLFWFKAPERIKAARCPTYYDLGNDELVRVGEWHLDKTSIKGRGWLVSKESVVAGVLRGHVIPLPPHVEEPSVKIIHLRKVVILDQSRTREVIQVAVSGDPRLVNVFDDSDHMFKSGYWITPNTWTVEFAWNPIGFFEKLANKNKLTIQWWPEIAVPAPVNPYRT